MVLDRTLFLEASRPLDLPVSFSVFVPVPPRPTPPPCATAHRYTAAEILSWHQVTEPSAALQAMDLPELMSEKSQSPEVRGEA